MIHGNEEILTVRWSCIAWLQVKTAEVLRFEREIDE